MLTKIQCVIQTYNAPATRELQTWLKHTGVDWRYAGGGYEIDVAKNREIVRFLKEDVPAGKEYILLIANDMVPARYDSQHPYRAWATALLPVDGQRGKARSLR